MANRDSQQELLKAFQKLSPEQRGTVLALSHALAEPSVAGGPDFDSSTRPIEVVLAELASEVPDSEWSKLPRDLTDNLDHYLYAIPKAGLLA
ncbi:MAG TPA: hypothetical protein VMT20_29700 [Terriglobia bacterium]|nr:hypothetical protein [Terriglobia bacterium]